MYTDKARKLTILKKLYANKCGQLALAKQGPCLLRYQVLKAEADAIKAELDISLQML